MSYKIIPDKPKSTELAKSDYTYALGLGFVFGVVTTILFNLFPDWLSAKGFGLYGLSGDAEIAIILGAVALVSWPISRLVEGISINLVCAFWDFSNYGSDLWNIFSGQV